MVWVYIRARRSARTGRLLVDRPAGRRSTVRPSNRKLIKSNRSAGALLMLLLCSANALLLLLLLLRAPRTPLAAGNLKSLQWSLAE